MFLSWQGLPKKFPNVFFFFFHNFQLSFLAFFHFLAHFPYINRFTLALMIINNNNALQGIILFALNNPFFACAHASYAQCAKENP